jgi:transposase
MEQAAAAIANALPMPARARANGTGSRMPYEVHEKMFEFVLKLVAERGLVKGERIGVDASTMEANAAVDRSSR